MSKIKISFVVTNCKKTGPIQQTNSIIRHMDRSVFEPSLITVWNEQGNSLFESYKELNIPIYSCALNKKSSLFMGHFKVGKILKKINPDIVQGVGMPPYRWTLGYKPAIHFITLRNYCYEDYPDQYGKVIGPIMAHMDMRLIRKRMKMGEPFVTCSESLTQIYKEKQGLAIPYIRNGVDISKYKKRNLAKVIELRKKLGLPIDRIIYVYSGRLIDRKNQEEAIKGFVAATTNEKCALVILGEGPEREKLEKLSEGRSNILFFGQVNNVPEFLQAADVYLATSKSEGLPNGVLEAMATGLPVLLSDIPQHMEVLEPDPVCGYSYHLSNVNQLSGLIDKMISEDLVSMGERSYQAVMNNFTAEGMSKRYQALYKKFAGK